MCFISSLHIDTRKLDGAIKVAEKEITLTQSNHLIKTRKKLNCHSVLVSFTFKKGEKKLEV